MEMKGFKSDMKTLLPAVFLFFLAFTLMSEYNASAQRGCENCSRHGMLDDFLNPNNPDYEERLKQWNDCMTQYLGNREFAWDTLNPDLKTALQNCQDLDPPEKWYCYPTMMSLFMGERFTSPCFHLLSPVIYSPETDKPPEYIFQGSYEANLQGGRIIEYADDYKKPVIARMELRLYYNGNTPELVTQWSSENTINEPRALFNKLKTPKSLNRLLEEFEKVPVSCDVRVPTPDEICEKDTCEIILSGFSDASGNPSREFNRIVVHVFAGTILNGEDSNFGPDRKVFSVGEGTIRVNYRPPAGGEEDFDRIRVYNSCDILPEEKYPYENTLPGQLIADEEFPITCKFDAILGIKGSYRKTEKSAFQEDNAWGKSERTHELKENREATLYVPLQLENSFDAEAQNLKYEYYRPLDIHLAGFNASVRDREYRSSVASDQGSETTILKSKVASDHKVSMKEVMLKNNIVMTSDLKTGKVLKINIDGFPLEFTWEETVDTHTESWWQPPPQPGHETKDDRQSSSSDDSYQVGPVGDPVPDPTIKSSTEAVMNYLKDMGVPLPAEANVSEEEDVSQTEPDLLVKSGDGKSYFGGEGRKIIDNSEGSTINRLELYFSWQVTRNRKPL